VHILRVLEIVASDFKNIPVSAKKRRAGRRINWI